MKNSLFKNEQFLERIFENSSLGETISNANGKWIRVNKAFCEMIGYTEEEIFELDYSEITHKDDREKDNAVFEKFIREKRESARLEKRFIHKDGHYVFVSMVATSFSNSKGEIEFFSAQFQDLSKLYRAEENREPKLLEDVLLESEERFGLAMKATKDGVFDADIGRETVWYSKNLLIMLGYKNETYVANTNTFFDEILHPEDKNRVIAQYHEQIANNEPIRFECRIKRRDGEVLWVEFRADSSKDAQGKLKRVIGSLSDISTRKEAELQQRLTFDAATCGMIMVDEAGIVTNMNSTMTKLFGYAENELVGQPIEMLLPKKYQNTHQRNRSDFNSAPSSRAMGRGMELFGLRKDGTEFPVEIGLNPVHFDGQAIVIATIVDVTVQKRAESALRHRAQELERSNSELEQFAYVASHDLQEPLRMVASFTELLAERYKDELDDRAKEYISFATDGAKRMQVLINDLLQYSRVGSKEKEFSSVDCNLLCHNLIEKELSLAIRESSADVIVNKLPKVMGDERQLSQLFQNMISNAVKYTAESTIPKIVISASEEEDKWRFSVCDNGIGIAPEFHSRIFIIFQRLHGKSEYSGTGIGLAICKKIVELHGGRIWLEPEPKQGSEFNFTIAKDIQKK